MFWLSKGNKSGTGFAARHTGKQHVATCQLATTGLASLTYVHRVSEKVGQPLVPGLVLGFCEPVQTDPRPET